MAESKIDSQIQAGFARSRRFLETMSIGLALAELFRWKPETLSLLGSTAQVTHPTLLMTLIWIAWAWSVAQYLLWLRKLSPVATLIAAKEGWYLELWKRRARKQPIPPEVMATFKIPNPQCFILKYWTAWGAGVDDPLGGYSRIRVNAIVQWYDKEAQSRNGTTIGTFVVEHERSLHSWYIAKSWFRAVFLEPESYEHFLPLLLALLPLIANQIDLPIAPAMDAPGAASVHVDKLRSTPIAHLPSKGDAGRRDL